MLKLRPLSFFTMGFALLLDPVHTYGQQTNPTLVAGRNLSVYQSPRNGLFCQQGEKLGEIKKGDEIAVYDEVKTFCGPFVPLDYLKIRYTTDGGLPVVAYVRRRESGGQDRFQSKSK